MRVFFWLLVLGLLHQCGGLASRSATVSVTRTRSTRASTRVSTRTLSRSPTITRTLPTGVMTRTTSVTRTKSLSFTRSVSRSMSSSSTLTGSRCTSGSRTPRATTRAPTVSMSVTVTRSVSQSRTLSVAPTRPPLACTATAGYYCMPATLAVAPCPAGVFGAVSGLTTPACSGNCTAAPGYFCPPGSTAPTATIICPVGAYCGGGGAGNVSCYPVTACTVAGLSAQPPCYWNVSTLAGSGVAGWADGQAAVAMFNAPNGVFFDPTSQGVFVGDHINNRVRSISPVGLVTTFVGSGSPGFVDGVGTSAALSGPAAVSLDTLGNMYVSDMTNNRIRKVLLSSGSTTTLAGSGTAGSANGVGIAAQIHNPSDIAVDASGAVGYVVAQGGSTIRTIDLMTKAVSTLAGSGIAGFADGVGTTAIFNLPGCAVWHPSGVLFVTDGWGGCVGCGNHRIRCVAISTAQVTTLAGNGVAGGANGLGTSATFNQPHGIALSATTSLLFIAEFSGRRVRSIDISTALVQTIAGTGNSGFGNGFGVLSVLNGPLYLTSSPSGVLFTADSGNNAIRQLTCVPCPASYYCASGAPVICPSGSYCPLSSINPTLCPTGTYGATTGLATPACSGPCTASPGYFCPPGSTSPTASLICPVGAFCGGGSAANVSCSLVTACSVTGLSAQPPCYWNVSTLAGSGVASSVNGVGTTAGFSNPYGLDSFGSELVVSEQTSACIRTVSLSSAQVITVAGLCGTPGLLDGSAATARFSTALSGVAALNSTYFAIADKGNSKVRLLKGGTVTSVPSLLSEPCGVFFINPSLLLVTDTGGSRILLVNLPTGSTAAVYGNGVATFADGSSATASFSQPISSVLSDKRIYVADWMNHRVRVIDTVVSVVTTLAGNGLTSVLNQPAGIAFFDAQTLVVTEFGNHRITLVTIADGKLAYIAGATTNSFADGFGLSARFNGPLGVVMKNSVVYVADRDNNRIRRLSCVPCPASFYCFSGAPVICPAGSYCPFSSVNATLSPPGTYSPSPGASSPTPCFSGTYNPLPGQSSCLQCEPGYFCPSNSTTMTPCGVNNYCPRGSSTPTPCPAFLAVDAVLGPANGPAYDVDTAACLAHCYSGGPGQTSTCG